MYQLALNSKKNTVTFQGGNKDAIVKALHALDYTTEAKEEDILEEEEKEVEKEEDKDLVLAKQKEQEMLIKKKKLKS